MTNEQALVELARAEGRDYARTGRINPELKAAYEHFAALIARNAELEAVLTEADGLLHFCDAHPLHWKEGPLAEQFRAFQQGLESAIDAARGAA